MPSEVKPRNATSMNVWFVDAVQCGSALEDWERQNCALDEATNARLSRILDDSERKLRRAVHIALRILIDFHAGPAWRGVPLQVMESGRPTLPNSGIGFSISHTHGAGLIALSQPAQVGVDLEARTRPVRLSPARQQAIIKAAASLVGAAGGGASEKEPDFLTAWVRLEAYAKATGIGIGAVLTEVLAPLRHAQVGPNQSPSKSELSAGAVLQETDIQVWDVDVGEGFVAAVAGSVDTAPPVVKIFPSALTGIDALLTAQ